MRIWMIRHGDPDYARDTLTETGKREASLLIPRMMREKIAAIYVSPLGRARDTAAPSLDALGQRAVVKEWLKEFPAKLDVNGSTFLQNAYPDTRKREDGSFASRIVWDLLPSQWMNNPTYLDPVRWRETEPARCSDMVRLYDRACAGLDELLADHGYVREGNLYRTAAGNNDTIVFFCHFGITCVLLSHFMNVSPFVLWHGMCMAPTSITEVYTEERQKGYVSFRATKIGDTAHLYAVGEQPSFSARFCETYENDWERH